MQHRVSPYETTIAFFRGYKILQQNKCVEDCKNYLSTEFAVLFKFAFIEFILQSMITLI